MLKVLISILVFLFCVPAFAQESVDVVTEQMPPWHYEEDGVVKGSATEIVRKVLDKAGVQYNITVYPWARAYEMALNQPNIIIYVIHRTEKREPLFKWIGLAAPVTTTRLYKLKSNQNVIVSSIEDAKKYPIAAKREGKHHKFLSKKGFAKIFPVNNRKQIVDMLQDGRTDLFIGTLKFYAKELEDAGMSIDDFEEILVVQRSYLYMAASKPTSDELYNKLMEAYAATVASGEIPKFE